MTHPSPGPAHGPFPPADDSPPPGHNRKTTIVIVIVIAAVLIAFIALHLTGVMGAGSH